MKPILIAAALLAGTFTKSFANENPINNRDVLQSFQSTFASASEVDWSTTNDFYKAVFLLNKQYVTAYFNSDGSMQAVTRHITASNLPLILQNDLKNNYKGRWVSDVLEVTNNDGLQYYATLENANTKIILKSSSTTWSTFEKQQKD